MVLMAMDHAVVAIRSWDHGQAHESEGDSTPVSEWNRPIGYIIRTFTHLCAPGFTFLLGMGVVYFGRSRTRLGWSTYQMLRHFVIRAAVLTLITVLMGVVFTGGKIWFLNAVLFALAIDYVFAGVLWLLLDKIETATTQCLKDYFKRNHESGETTPLLVSSLEGIRNSDKASTRAIAISWHFSNGILVALAVVTAWWNVWLSPTHGHCQTEKSSTTQDMTAPGNPMVDIWFWPIMSGRIMSVRPLSPARLNSSTLLVALAFFLLFAFTRIFRFGNLSEGCLHMPEHIAHPDRNPYLASVPSFFYVIKYPPDVAFVAYTMSVNLSLLALFGALPSGVTKRFTILLTYGTSALFFYLVHQIILFSAGAVLARFFGRETDETDPFTGQPALVVENIWIYWGLWATALAILYPLCKWYGGFKKTKGPDSIWRFF
ncbi:Membrane protein [Apiospora aurea]|uniref:Membrane protein n=1 Tax=Apiospora aurea TaxID=335848 RepID=A0ABR1Q7I4_9PEZI